MGQQWQIAINAPLKHFFTYLENADQPLCAGTPVLVPFGKGNRKVSGMVIKPAEQPTGQFNIKNIHDIYHERPPLTTAMMDWLRWLAEYYVYPLGQIQEMAYPPLKKRTTPRKSQKTPPVPNVTPATPPTLMPDQAQVLAQVQLAGFHTHLLHGVTGSGKTEVYIRLIEKVLGDGGSAVLLVPEISLTPQLLKRFAERLDNQVAVIHSHLTDRERTEQWWSVVSGEKKVLVGARSALFCPIPHLRLIIVDEEHEASFKQEEKLKYNARDAAIMRGHFENCPVILGSATPSIESWYNAKIGKSILLTMQSRVSNRPLPTMEIVNLAKCRDGAGHLPYWLSPQLFSKLSNNFARQQQSALFLNRRGVAPTVQCYDCGFIFMCPNCDISLTLHGQNHLVCHYCGYFDSLGDECPECHTGVPKAYGLGTEAIERDLQQLFPSARILRADRDEIHSREAIEDLVTKMENNEVDFLVGTQMIAKGLDFPNLTLVGLVLADIAFNIPDFRASERSFQLCTQVSGRAGRHESPGEVIIQTFKPEHPSLKYSQLHDYAGYIEHELRQRQIFSYPPYGKIAAIRLSGLVEREVQVAGREIAEYLKALINNFANLKDSHILGPVPAPLSRIKNKYRYHLLIKSPSSHALMFINGKAAELIEHGQFKAKCQIDHDPYSMM